MNDDQAKQAPARCKTALILLDDHWGAMPGRCELPVEHDGEHSIAYRASMPFAHMRWTDDPAFGFHAADEVTP